MNIVISIKYRYLWLKKKEKKKIKKWVKVINLLGELVVFINLYIFINIFGIFYMNKLFKFKYMWIKIVVFWYKW